uniref:Monensin-resistant 2 n=1 Tax=Ascaris suum TaxID=6253 RepID=F1KQN5_ASCSU
MSGSSSTEAKRLVESLLGDLRSLSTEARKKHSHVKEAAESGLVKIRNINSGSNEQNLLTNLRSASSELLQPLTLGCASKNARLVQISLQAIQKMIQYRVIEPMSAPVIVNELWHLMEAECEELRILQTLTPLVSTEMLVCGQWLAKCLVMCFRLNFAKDPIVINTASATVRQMVNCVFERVIQEDGMKSGELPIVHQTVKINVRAAPPTLRPCAADGYMLFRDLCLLINAEPPCWLIGIQEMTRTLGLELLESVLAIYPSIFVKHSEFAQLLKDQVCPLVIRLFAPNHKHMQIASQHPHSVTSRSSVESATVGQMPGSPERPYFPISMRLLRVVAVLITHFYELLVTECEIFLSLLVKFLESDKLGWQRAIALEVLHRIVVQPDLLLWFCESYDARQNSAKVVHSMMSGLAAYVQLSFLRPDIANAVVKDEEQPFDSGGQSLAQSGFLYRGIWIPLSPNISAKKSILLDSLDKHEAIILPEGYALSLTYECIIDGCQCIFEAIDSVAQNNGNKQLSKELFQSSYSSLLAALSLLLDASVDESITEQLLKCVSTLALLSCRLEHTTGRDAAMFALCKAALPPNYLVRVLGGTAGLNNIPGAMNTLQDKDANKGLKSSAETFESESTLGQPSQVVAMGTICPTPSLPSHLFNAPVMLTAKNVQVSRVLIGCTQTNGQQLGDCWHLVLASVQHLVWILGMKPSIQGGFRTEGEGSEGTSMLSGATSGTSVLTTAVMADVPVMASMLNKLFDSTSQLDDVALHHVIAALCKLSSESMLVSQNGTREPSFFPVAKLQQTAMANLERLEVFWKPIAAHLIEVSSHSYAKLREWGALALTTLIKNAVKTKADFSEARRQQLILAPLQSMCEVEFVDVRRRQIECLVEVLQWAGQQLCAEQWPVIIEIIRAVVAGPHSFDDALIRQSYDTLALVIADFLDILPFSCAKMLIETDAKYGAQQCELNISLSALGQLWTISDFVYRKSPKLSDEESETIWLVLYNCLSELCVDPRPPVRKSACQTLLQTIAAHGLALKANTWKHMIWKILFPMLDKVRALTRSASTVRTDSAALGASNILIHHSRDTESKQWAETSVHTLSGVVKIFNAQRSLLLGLEDFASAWTTLLQYIEYLAASDNNEMSLAALKSFQEVLLGRVSQQTLADMGIRERSTGATGNSQTMDEVPPLPEPLWISSWQTWMRISRSLITPHPANIPVPSSERPSTANAKKSDGPTKHYIPGPSHFTTILHIFSPLFERVKKKILVNELKYEGVPKILKDIIGVPVSTEQAPFIMSTCAEITPTQEAVLDCVRVMYLEMVDSNSALRPALPDLLRLMLDFTLLSIRAPTTEFLGKKKDSAQWWVQNMVPFAELSLRTLVEFYANTAHYHQIVQSTVLVDIVKCLTQPMELKYDCPSQSTWKAAASAFLTVLRIGLPIARQQTRLYRELWPAIADAFEQFLFTTSHPSTPLNADERKRHEFIDCQIIELIRNEILPYANNLPPEFIQRIIDVLNRGSISTLDPNDVLALDSYLQRTDLSRVCFDALLSMSQSDEPDIIRSASSQPQTAANDLTDGIGVPSDRNNPSRNTSSLGASAIASLLARCRQVIAGYVRDEQGAGQLPLPQERTVEMISVLRAVGTLIDGLVRRADAVNSDFYAGLVTLYPLLIDCVPSSRADVQVEQCLMETLRGYQTLLLLKVHR